MSYTVGLDFGTHQTKVCIEDASNPAQKIYEFFEFDDLQGVKSVLFPSIVQINNDDSVSYGGYVDESNCKTMSLFTTMEPMLVLPEEPKLELPIKPEKLHPPKPKKPDLKGHSIKEQLLFQDKFTKDYSDWESKCRQIDKEHNKNIENWELDCTAIQNDYNYDLDDYNSEKHKKQKEFEIALAIWEKDSMPRKHIFRYFKLATFSDQDWQFGIEPEIISVWYLTFILFKIRENFGNDFYNQMGVPSSFDTHDAEKQKSIAYKLLIEANRLISEYKNLDYFLKAKYTDLLKNTNFDDYTEKNINELGLNVLPEAFAGLSSITQQGKLSRGMHLLVDIGGGTTDIAFFTITEKKLPDIHAVLSFPQGLNYIFENFIEINNLSSIAEVQHLFMKTQKGFDQSVSVYQSQLNDKAKKMIQRIECEFKNREPVHGRNVKELIHALSDKPLVYCGGGSMYDKMRIQLHYFTDVRLINKDLLSIPYVKNKNIDTSLFTILATSYGLSIQLENEIQMTPIEKVFDPLPPKVTEDINDSPIDYGLADT
ncbi:MAG: hypothetical protein Q8N05_17910 [Bacteroidota bacterium]|nr:hypothetical protein [Bacteroidota bacterium]